ncbi:MULTISPECIES: Dyp-type peroxidase [Corynebacterium]|uniref:Dyp-type peroxidase n=1 Tax=Corynebacterium TaxID=1716 RepID=UPI00124D4BF0|nr:MULTISPECIES: Dyp-type peroxidase [Corynebacterium]
MSHQSGITGLGTTDHIFLEFDLAPGADGCAVLRHLAEAINLPTTHGVNVVLGVRPSLWAEVADAEYVPDKVHDFSEPISGSTMSMPATQHDAWLWVAGSSRSQVFDISRTIANTVRESANLVEETTGWVYQHNRDLTGFEDGTENPPALEAPSVVAVPEGRPGAGSSVLLYQLWEHKAVEWEALQAHIQEQIIGRTKSDSVELDEDTNPESSHVNRTVVEVGEDELEIFRRNVSYGDMSTHGTVFVGFSFDQWRMEEMLRRMAGVDGGPADRLTEFTTPLSGGWYVCPSTQALASLL